MNPPDDAQYYLDDSGVTDLDDSGAYLDAVDRAAATGPYGLGWAKYVESCLDLFGPEFTAKDWSVTPATMASRLVRIGRTDLAKAFESVKPSPRARPKLPKHNPTPRSGDPA